MTDDDPRAARGILTSVLAGTILWAIGLAVLGYSLGILP